jgi:glycopeptide antibiotics resistance protein
MTRCSVPYAILATAYLGIVAALTLGPTLWVSRAAQPDPAALSDDDVLSLTTWLDGETWTRIGSPEFTANILLFVPLGLLLRLAVPRATWLGATTLGGAVSVVVEVLQVSTPRVSDPRDLLANTLGALIGALLGAAVSGIASLRRRTAQPVVGIR